MYTKDAAPADVGCVMVMFAFGNKVVFDEVAVTTKLFSKDSASATVKFTGLLVPEPHAIVVFDGVVIVGAVFVLNTGGVGVDAPVLSAK